MSSYTIYPTVESVDGKLEVDPLPLPMALATTYLLHVIRAQGPTWESTLRGREPKLYVTVKVAGTKKVIPIIEGDLSPEWKASLTFSAPDTACVLKIQVKHRSTWSSDPCIGYVEVELGKLLRDCESGEAVLDLSVPHKKSSRSMTTAGTICLELKTVDLLSSVETDVSTLQQTVDSSCIGNAVDSTTLSRVGDASRLTDGNDLYKSIGGLLSKLEIIAKVIDDVSELNPYLKAAWDLTSLVYKSIANVFQVDKKAADLARALDETFDFVSETQTLRNKTRILEPHIIKLLRTTCDCCEFLQKYLPRGFVGRLFSLDASATIDGFVQSVREQKNDLNLGLAIHNAHMTAQTCEKLATMCACQSVPIVDFDSTRQKDLRQVLGIPETKHVDRQKCQEGTRIEILKHLIDLLGNETSPSIVWLHGVAGSGKSTIATSIEDHFRERSQLGAFLKFERGKSEPSTVVRELAYKLALSDSSIRSRIIEHVKQDTDIASALLSRQFEKLLLEPLVSAAAEPIACSPQGVLVIVLDALDECGTPHSRSDLMRLLKTEFSKLPRTFRFLITSRPEPDIMNALSSRPESIHEAPLDYTSDISRRDVLSYLQHEMCKIINSQVKLPNDWPWDSKMDLLGEAAGGLFIWASTAVKLVAMSDNPIRKLKSLVSDSRLLSKHGLDDLYTTVLRSSGISWDDDDSKARVSAVLGLLLFSKIPLSNEDIDGFLGFPPEESSHLILSRLRCLLSYSPGEPVRLFHSSFFDYLQSPERSGDPWFLDIPSQKTHVAMRCFAVMKDSLHFNMCDLETSFIRNDEVQGLDNRIKANIPLHLEYACTHWAQHLGEVATSSCLLNALKDFAYRQLLFWFEVLSLLRIFHRITSRALPDAASWATCNTTVSSFLKDASFLATVFADPISQNTPHIYISMLPLTRQDSEVSAHYSQWMSSMVRVQQKGVKPKPMWLKVLEGHLGGVNTVYFSPDGRYIVSGSDDGTVRIWGSDSGELIHALVEGNTEGVFSVSMSTNGQYISSASYSATIRTWNMQDGAFISCRLLNGNTERTWPAAFSSDGTYFVTICHDDTVHLWNTKSGDAVILPFEIKSGSGTTVAVSPTGRLVVSCSNAGVVRLWDVEYGMAASKLLRADGDCTSCIAFSPDGARVAIIYNNETTIWNVATQEAITWPFVGHTGQVICIAFSPDGGRVVSGSCDNTIRVWGIGRGEAVAGPFIGHSDAVTSVAFSPDGSHIVSGSNDSTVRLWHVSSVSNFTASSNENTSKIRIVAFSPDDSKIVSVSEDRTIRVWDVGGESRLSRCFEGDDSRVLSLAFSPDGSNVILGSDDGTIRVWELSTGAIAFSTRKAHADSVESISVSPDGRFIVSASNDNTRIWDWTTGAVSVVAAPFVCTGYITSVALSPDASRAVYGTKSGELILWDIWSGDVILGPFSGHKYDVTSVVFSHDGRYFGSRDDYDIRVWNATTGDLVSGPLTGQYFGIAFSPDGSKIVSGYIDGTITLQDVMTGQLTADDLEGHRNCIYALAFSHDGRHVASGSNDRTIRLWDVEGAESAYGSPDKEDTTNWRMTSDGWIISRKEELLLWIPPDLRLSLVQPRNMAVYGCSFWTEVDFRNASIGSHWRDCFKPS